MRGEDQKQSAIFGYVTLEQRIPTDHPLRSIRAMTDRALERMSGKLEDLYSATGRRSIAPERLMRGLLLQVLYSVRSERQLIEQLDYNLLFRWFMGLEMDDEVWDVTVFSKKPGASDQRGGEPGVSASSAGGSEGEAVVK